MKFFTLFVSPDEATLRLPPEQLRVSPERWTHVYGQSKELILKGDFVRPIEADGRQYVIRFRGAGKTAASVAYFQMTDPKTPKLDAITLLLGGLDPAEDAKLLKSFRANKNLQFCSDAEWERLERAQRPVAISFFTDDSALNSRGIHGLMSIVAPAYFDLLGLGVE